MNKVVETRVEDCEAIRNKRDSILIYRQGSVGDTAVALPAFRLIKKAFPDAKRSVLTNMPVNSKACALDLILKNTGLIDDYVEYPSKSSLLKKIISLRKIIKKNNVTTMVYLNQTRHLKQAWRDYLFFKLCGVKKIIGLSLREHGYHYLYNPETRLYENEYHRLVRQLKEIGRMDCADPATMDLALTQDEIAYARATIPDDMFHKPFIVCSIGTKLEMKDWGQDNWKAFISVLSQQCASSHGMIFIGVHDEYSRSDELLRCWTGDTLNLCGKLTVRQSAALIGFSHLFVGHDSGPMHLAAAVGKSCVAIFSRHAKPGCWFPYGAQHTIVYPKGESILSITVDDVVQAVSAKLGVGSVVQ